MQINALLDVDVVALESDDTLSVLLELTAPSGDLTRRRPPANVQIVLDRSGSMHGERLDAAKTAIDALITRLDPTDRFGVVTFDDTVEVTIPLAPLTDKDAARARVGAIESGGMTNLSSGYLRGLQEIARAGAGGPATLLLLSDGHANQGVTDQNSLGDLAAGARTQKITTSTIGIGLDYDEALLATVARGGAGNAVFAEDGDTAGAHVAAEVDGLLEQVVQAASLVMRPLAGVERVALFNDLPVAEVDGGFMVELGDFYAGEQRKLLLELHVPAMPALGLATVGLLELRWVALPSLVAQTVTVPLSVNVVPSDEAAGRVPNPVVVTEKGWLRLQREKRVAAEALRRGDIDAARRSAAQALGDSAAILACAPPAMADEIAEEQAFFRDLAARAVHDGQRMAKIAEADSHRKDRKRGRR